MISKKVFLILSVLIFVFILVFIKFNLILRALQDNVFGKN